MATPTIIIGDQVLLGFAASRAKIEELLRVPVTEISAASKLSETAEERLPKRYPQSGCRKA